MSTRDKVHNVLQALLALTTALFIVLVAGMFNAAKL